MNELDAIRARIDRAEAEVTEMRGLMQVAHSGPSREASRAIELLASARLRWATKDCHGVPPVLPRPWVKGLGR